MQILKIKTNKKTSIYSIEKRDGHLCFISEIKKSHYHSTTIRRVNPLPSWLHHLKWQFIEFKYTRNNEIYKLCQGCGMGVAKYKIRDPNYGNGHKYFNCCDGCVDFYDMRWSKMKIVSWKKQGNSFKAIGKRLH